MGDTEKYLKTQQVANALGVSVSTVKRWVDSGDLEATRTVGKHRLVPLSSALRFAREERFPVEPLLAIQTPPSSIVLDNALIERFLDALWHGRSREVRELVGGVCDSRQGAVGLADLLIRPALARVGNGWVVGSWDIYQEHQATLMIAAVVMEQIRRYCGPDDEARPLAIGASPAGDPYILPGLLGELVLSQLGWRVKNLSNNLPLRSLANATRALRPKIVFLAVSQVVDREGFVRDYAEFYEAANQVGSAIILGGRGVDLDLRSSLVYAGFGERMAHLAEFARHLHPTAEANLDLGSIQQGPLHNQT